MNFGIGKPFFTIIIPVKQINDYVRETVSYILKINRSDWEVFVVTNQLEPDEWSHDKIKIIESGPVGPAKKRDQAAIIANGDILVFFDDDSYPKADILDHAYKNFKDENIVAVGGPAVTPNDDSFYQKLSGAVFLSKWSGGFPERYIPIGEMRYVDDWPSVNLMVRKKQFIDVGGFNTVFWPGEDTKLCLELILSTRKKIIYDPKMLVWHHRREGIGKHLKQIGAYGMHRGYFVKKFPETSRKIKYFLPSFFVAYIVLSLFLYGKNLHIDYSINAIGIMYLMAIVNAEIDITKYAGIKIAIAAIPYIFMTHIVYGICFIRGLLTKQLVSKLR